MSIQKAEVCPEYRQMFVEILVNTSISSFMRKSSTMNDFISENTSIETEIFGVRL